MVDSRHTGKGAAQDNEPSLVERLRRSLEDGHDWCASMVEVMALWTVPRERLRKRDYNYFIAGEAFDWLLLAERLMLEMEGYVPEEEKEELLFRGRLPPSFHTPMFKNLLGVDKYRGYLNYFYGVTVEEALQLATELEVHKRQASNGVQYMDDFADEAFLKIYGKPADELLEAYRQEGGLESKNSIGLGEAKEFTYWLFKYRLNRSDRARIASDTRKGLDQLRRMGAACEVPVAPY